MNIEEIDNSLDDIRRALGFSVQSVSLNNKTLVLSLSQNKSYCSLVISLEWGLHSLFLIENLNRKFKTQKKPLGLFANTHLKNSVFTDVVRDLDKGRVVIFYFNSTEGEEICLEVILIPALFNISLKVGLKSVHLVKPKEIPKINLSPTSTSESNFKRQIRDIVFFKDQWLKSIDLLNSKKNSNLVAPNFKRNSLDLEIEKKQKLVSKIKIELADKQDQEFYLAAKLLETDPEQAELQYPHLMNKKVSLRVLINNLYEKHKIKLQKVYRVKERLNQIQNELINLKSITEEEWVNSKSKSGFKKEALKASDEVKARKLEVSSDIVAFMGKSAQDNLKLLRAAKSWHLWIHLKDKPSSHLIVFKDKSREVTSFEMEKICSWFIEQTEKSGKDNYKGSLVEFLIVECRYVRPIKGDKVGRVNFSNEKIFRLRL